MAINTRNIFELAARKAHLVDSDTSAIEMGDLLNILEKTGGGFVREYATEGDLPIANDIDEKVRVAYTTTNGRLYMRNSSGWTKLVGDDNYDQVQLLLKTNGSITDASNNAATITPVGDTTQSGTESKFATRSIFFDGTGDYLSVPSSSNLAMGTEDFTIELWINLDSLTDTVGGQDGVFVEMRSSQSNVTGFVFNCKPSASNFVLNFYTDGGSNAGATTMAYSTWHHVAVTRESGTVRLFVNGTLDTSFTKANNFSDTPTVTIGQSLLYSSSNIAGYIEDLRITKGTARYTANFTPPTEAFDGF